MIAIIQAANASYGGLLKLQKTLRFPTAFCVENLLIERMAGNYLSNTFLSQIIHNEFSISSTRNEQMTSLTNFFQAFNWALMTVQLALHIFVSWLPQNHVLSLFVNIDYFASLVATSCDNTLIWINPNKIQNWVLMGIYHCGWLEYPRFAQLSLIDLLNVVCRKVFVIHSFQKLNFFLVIRYLLLWICNYQLTSFTRRCKNVWIGFGELQAVKRTSCN